MRCWQTGALPLSRAMRWGAIITRCCATGWNNWRSRFAAKPANANAACSPIQRRYWKWSWHRRRIWAGAASTRCCCRANRGRGFFWARYLLICRYRRTHRMEITAALAGPAWTSAPHKPSQRLTSSMHGAVFPTSPSNSRTAFRLSCVLLWAIASMAATIASWSARGTVLRISPSSRILPCATVSMMLHSPSFLHGMSRLFTAGWRGVPSAASAMNSGCVTSPWHWVMHPQRPRWWRRCRLARNTRPAWFASMLPGHCNAIPQGEGRHISLDNFARSHKMRASSGSLAQLVEQRTLNPFVAGSIPARPTKIQGVTQCVTPFLFPLTIHTTICAVFRPASKPTSLFSVKNPFSPPRYICAVPA